MKSPCPVSSTFALNALNEIEVICTQVHCILIWVGIPAPIVFYLHGSFVKRSNMTHTAMPH